MADATFEDGAEGGLNLKAYEGEDLQVIASLAQDAVLTTLFPYTTLFRSRKSVV